jgi:hypothetical protein
MRYRRRKTGAAIQQAMDIAEMPILKLLKPDHSSPSENMILLYRFGTARMSP